MLHLTGLTLYIKESLYIKECKFTPDIRAENIYDEARCG